MNKCGCYYGPSLSGRVHAFHTDVLLPSSLIKRNRKLVVGKVFAWYFCHDTWVTAAYSCKGQEDTASPPIWLNSMGWLETDDIPGQNRPSQVGCQSLSWGKPKGIPVTRKGSQATKSSSFPALAQIQACNFCGQDWSYTEPKSSPTACTH